MHGAASSSDSNHATPDLGAPRFIGFLPKRITPVPRDWVQNPVVTHVRSVSVCECLAKMPDRWIDHWIHNDVGHFNTEADAWSVVPQADRDQYELLACRLFMREFDDGHIKPLAWPPTNEGGCSSVAIADEPNLSGWQRVGYDLCGRTGAFFECSPLSCNGAAAEYRVNRWCLIDVLAEAIAVGLAFSRLPQAWEPGKYFLIEVLVWSREL